MTYFNETVLAKHVCRVLIENDTLVHQCLKEKFFHNSNLIKAIMKPTNSYMWKILVQTKEKLLKGCYITKIWGDH